MKKIFTDRANLLLLLIICIAGFLSFYKASEVPACINSDEAAFGYNSFALLQTGKDEFGNTLPFRLQSFNDFKLPLYSYLSMPFIGIFGLDDFSTRFLNRLLAIALVPSIYIVALHIFKKKSIALLSATFIALAPWTYILSRHAHEGMIMLVSLIWALYFTVRYKDTNDYKNLIFSSIFLVIASHAYHLGRFFVLVFLMYQGGLLLSRWKSKNKNDLGKFIVIVVFTIALSWGVDAYYGAPRVNNLFFFQDANIELSVNEKLRNGGNRIINNKLTESIFDVSRRYINQIAPEFFAGTGDKNPRFGYVGIGYITPVEYLLIFIGLYYLFRNKNEYRYLLLLLFLLSPLPNALTWQERSLLRSFFMIVPIVLISGYGLYSLLYQLKGSKKMVLISLIGAAYVFYSFFSWNTYLNHYFPNALVTRSWQCGYKELVDYVNKNYDENDTFYISRRNGQPYIYLLFYSQTNPEVFQKIHELTEPDEYGFTQVKSFDKFVFDVPPNQDKPNSTYIGYIEEFNDNIPESLLEKITVNNEDIFWILDTDKLQVE